VAYTWTASSSLYGMQVSFGFPALTGSQTVAITEIDVRATPGLPTGQQSYPPVAEMRPVWADLSLCQRYFWQPTAAIGVAGYVTAGSYFYTLLSFPVRMRVTPTLTGTPSITFGASGTMSWSALGSDAYSINDSTSGTGTVVISLPITVTASAEL